MLKNVVSRLRFRNISCKNTSCFFMTSTPNQSFGVPVIQCSARQNRTDNDTRDLYPTITSVYTQYEDLTHTVYPDNTDDTMDYSSRHQQRNLDVSSDYDRVEELFFNKLDSKKSSIKAEDRFVGVGIDTLDGDLFDTCREETCDQYRQDASIQAPRRVSTRGHETSGDADAESTTADSGACGSATDTATCRQKLLSTLQVLQNKEETLAVQAASLREAEERISKLSARNQMQNEQLQKHQEELSTLRQNIHGLPGVSGTNESFVMFGSCTQELDGHKNVIKNLQNNISVIEELYKECFYESAKQEQLIDMLRQSYLDVRAMERSKAEEIIKIKKMFMRGDGKWKFEELSSDVEKLKLEIHNFLTSSNGSSSNNDSGMWERSEDGSSVVAELSDDLRHIVTQLETLRDILAVDPCQSKIAEENARLKKQVKDLKKELDCKQKQLREKEKKNELLQKFLDKNKETLCKLKQSGKLKKEKELSCQLKLVERELKDKRKTLCEYEKILEEKICDKRTAKYIEKLKETNKGKEKEIVCLRKRISELESLLEESDMCDSELEDRLQSTRQSTRGSARASSIQSGKCNCGLARKNEILKEKCCLLEKQVCCLNKEVRCLRDKLCQLEEEQTCREPCVNEDDTGKQCEIEQLKGMNNCLQDENICLKKENECLRCENEKLEEKICDLEKCRKSRDKNQDSKGLKEENACLIKENECLRCEIEKLQEQICDLDKCTTSRDKSDEKCMKESYPSHKEKKLIEVCKSLEAELTLVRCRNQELETQLRETGGILDDCEDGVLHTNKQECTCQKGYCSSSKEVEILRKKQETVHAKLCEAEALLSEKQRMICELQNRCGNRNDSRDDETCLLKKHICDLNEIIARKDECIRQLQCSQNTSLKECRCDKDDELTELKRINECYECEISSLNQKLRCLEETLRQRNERINELEEILEQRAKDTKCRCSRKKNQCPPPEDCNLKQRVCQLELFLKDKERCIQEMQTKMDEKRIDCYSKREALKEKINCLENEICDLNAKIADLQRQLCERDNCITERNEELRKCRSELCTLTRDAEELRRSVMEQFSVTGLRKSLQEALDQLTERTKEMEQLQYQVNCYKQQEADSSCTRRRLEEMEQELCEKENDYKSILQEKERLINELRDQVCCIEQGSRASLEQQQQGLEALTQKLRCTEESLCRKSEELCAMQARCDSQELNIKRLKEELNNADKIIMESKKVRSEVSYLSQQVCLWREQLQQSQQTVRELSDQLQEAREQYRQLEAEYKCKEQSSCFLQRELETVTARGAALCEETRRILAAVREWAHHVQAHKVQLCQKVKDQQNVICNLRRRLEIIQEEPPLCSDVRGGSGGLCDEVGSCSRTRHEVGSERARCGSRESATEEDSCSTQPKIRILKKKTCVHRLRPPWSGSDQCEMVVLPGPSQRPPAPPNLPGGYSRTSDANTRFCERGVSRGEVVERGEALRTVRGEGERRWGRRH